MPPPASDNVPSRGHAIYVACIVAPIISGIFVLLRAYARFFVTKKNYASDWVSYATWVAVVCFSITLAPATWHGMGRHTWDFTPEMSSNMYFWILVSSEFYVLSLAGYKGALVLLYLQLFGVNRKFRYICYGVLFYTWGYLFCNLIVEVSGCRPIRKFWLPKTPGHCTNSIAQNIAFGAGHMSSDLIIAILPLPMIWRLQLRSTKEKWGLAAVLGSGVIAWTVAVVRFTYASVDLTSSDRTWIAGVTFFLSVLEVNTGLICSCTPSLKPLVISARDTTLNWSRKYSLNEWSRKRSQPGISTNNGTDTAASGGKGFVELKPVSKGSARSGELSSDEERDRRPTYWQEGGKIAHAAPATQEGKLSTNCYPSGPPGQVQEEEEYEDGPYAPKRQPKNPGAKHWDDYSMGTTSTAQGRPAPPHLTSDELFEGTGVRKPSQGVDGLSPLDNAPDRERPRTGQYKNSWYTNEAV